MPVDTSKRRFVSGAAGLLITAGVGAGCSPRDDGAEFDLIVVGGGNAGLPTALFAARRGAKVLIVDIAPRLGGTLLLTGGRMSAAGTKLQRAKGIDDSPDLLFQDVMALSDSTADPELLRLFVDHSGPTFDWLMDNGFEVADGVPANFGMTHEAQNRARYVWSDERGIGIYRVLERAMAPLIANGAIAVQTSTEVTGLVQEQDGRISGVLATDEAGNELRFNARNVALTSGGYASNSEMFERLEGAPDYSKGSNPNSQGVGITLGLSVGGFVLGGEHHLPNFGAILADSEIPSDFLAGMVQPPERPPWEIWVNRRGERFIAEDTASMHAKELALVEQPDESFWIVFDDAIFKQAPPVVRRWSREEMQQSFAEDAHAFKQAETLVELAEKAGLDAGGLAASVSDYNSGLGAATDGLGRVHRPLPIQQGPFYAVRSQASQIIGFAGLAVDERLRVRRTDGPPIPNLYAAGELLGAGQLMGKCYFGGMMVTPALTFGRLLGQELISLEA